MPALTEPADLHTLADAARHNAPLHVEVEEDAEAVMNASLERTGLLLLGECHGVRQTPRVIAALLDRLDIRTLALEWPEQLTATVDTYCRTGVLDDHELLWLGDGRLTAGHLGLLRDLADGIPMGAWLDRGRPGLRSVTTTYGAGVSYNLGTTPLLADGHPTAYRIRLDEDRLLLDHPSPTEADVPHRPDLFVIGQVLAEPTT